MFAKHIEPEMAFGSLPMPSSTFASIVLMVKCLFRNQEMAFQIRLEAPQ